MVELPGPTRRDRLMWAAGLALAAGGTVIAWAAGARLGSALTLGVGLLALSVVGGLALQGRR